MFASPLAVAAYCALIASGFWIYRDYRQWVDFGTGGTPPNLAGYWKIRRWGLATILTKDDLRDASKLALTGPSYLKKPLAIRKGSPPRIMPRLLPQRQVPEPIEPNAKARLFNILYKLQQARPDVLVYNLSKTEGGSTDAIYAKPDVQTTNQATKVIGYEIAHVHPSDNSLHVLMSLVDARAVVEAGWGQRFPLNPHRFQWNWVPEGWIMVYAPRTDAEVDTIEEIVKAAAGWVAGIQF